VSKEDKWIVFTAIFFLAVGAIASFGFTRGVVNGTWKIEAVKRGFAEYSRTTGEWQWKESVANEH
jgi:hypothetical protein